MEQNKLVFLGVVNEHYMDKWEYRKTLRQWRQNPIHGNRFHYILPLLYSVGDISDSYRKGTQQKGFF